MSKTIILCILLIAGTQLMQVLFISANQETNPLLFVIPMDLIMLAGLFAIIEKDTR